MTTGGPDTSPNQGRGTLSAVIPTVGAATGGRYLLTGQPRLKANAWAKATGGDSAAQGGLMSWGEHAILNREGSLGGVPYTELVFFPVTGYYNAVADPSVSGVVNQPRIQAINALVTFTPRLAKGRLLYMSSYLVTNAYNAEQTVFLVGNPHGGTWTLMFGADITDPLDWDASPGEVQAALEALASIGAGNIHVVVGDSPLSYKVEFINDLGNHWMPPLVGDADLLTTLQGAGFCEITVTVTALGSPQVIADTAVALPALTARIWNGVLSTIDYNDTPGFQLAANTGALNTDGDLIYDTSFSAVTFNGASQFLAPFAFVAPNDDTPICLTDPSLTKLAYQAPSETAWTPSQQTGGAIHLVGGRKTWRQRAS